MVNPAEHLGLYPVFSMPGLLRLTGSSPYWVGMTMFRLQEFYESKHEELRDQFFTLERAIDLYSADKGLFDYPQEWLGFNVPGWCVDKFFTLFRDHLSEKERHLEKLVDLNRQTPQYYLIGCAETVDPAYVRHEMAHAAFYLDETYRDKMTKLVDSLNEKDQQAFTEWFQSETYHGDVFVDECQAYLSTNSDEENRKLFPKMSPAAVKPFRDYFNRYNRGR
jgi:hypothetical protein